MTVTTDRQTELAGELRDVNKWYGERHVLTDVSVTISHGEIVALIGKSGSGKSTVLRVFAGLSPDHTGDRTVSGSPALAFQEPRLFPCGGTCAPTWSTASIGAGSAERRPRLGPIRP